MIEVGVTRKTQKKERGIDHEETRNEEEDGQKGRKKEGRQESKKNSQEKGC